MFSVRCVPAAHLQLAEHVRQRPHSRAPRRRPCAACSRGRCSLGAWSARQRDQHHVAHHLVGVLEGVVRRLGGGGGERVGLYGYVKIHR